MSTRSTKRGHEVADLGITLRKLAAGFGWTVADFFRGFELDDPNDDTAELVALVRGRGPRVIALIVELVRVFLRAFENELH